MRSTLACALIVAATLGHATPALAQAGLPLRGHISMGADVVVFEPCGAFEPYALSISREIGNELLDALEAFGGPTHGRVFIAMQGWVDTGPMARAASAFTGTWLPTRLETIRREADADCADEPPPLWLGRGCERLSPPDLYCLPVDLVEADLRLARYVTEAMEHTAHPGELTAAHAVWKRNRELRCSGTRPGGNVDALWV